MDIGEPAHQKEALQAKPDLEETMGKQTQREGEIIELAEGKVLLIQYEGVTKRPQSIRAEVPVRHYQSFCEELKQLATLQVPSPTISENDQKVIQIQVRFIFPE